MQTIGFSRAEAEVYMHKLEVLVVVKFKVFMDQVVMKWQTLMTTPMLEKQF